MHSQTHALLERARTGDQDAWSALAAQHDRRIIAVLASFLRLADSRAELIDDLRQEVHLEAFRKLPDFEHRGPGSFGRWLAQIARLKARDALKRERKGSGQARLDHTGSPTLRSLRTTPAAGAVKRELTSVLVRAMDDLPEDYRRVIALRFFEGMTGPEIAEAMDRSAGAVRVLFFRAMARLGELAGSSSLGAEGASGSGGAA